MCLFFYLFDVKVLSKSVFCLQFRFVIDLVLMKKLFSVLMALGLFFSAHANAQHLQVTLGTTPCWDQAAKYHGLDPWLLYAVAYVESRHNPSVISKPNRNGTYDIGLMQINSIWLPELRRYGIDTRMLKNACASTYVGAWVMAKNVRRYGYSWKAIAAYNVGSVEDPVRRRIGYNYAKKVYDAYDKLSRHRRTPHGSST